MSGTRYSTTLLKEKISTDYVPIPAYRFAWALNEYPHHSPHVWPRVRFIALSRSKESWAEQAVRSTRGLCGRGKNTTKSPR